MNLQEKASTNLYSFDTLNALFVRTFFSEMRVLHLRAINRVPHNVVEEKQYSKKYLVCLQAKMKLGFIKI